MRSCVALLSIVGLSTPPAIAQFDPAWTWNRHPVNVYTTGAITTTRGWEFQVTRPVEVVAIGVYDLELFFGSGPTALSFPGLAQAHPVALWNVLSQATPLATGDVPAGQVTPLCRDGYRYASITPTLLMPGQHYVVSAFWPGDTGVGNFDPYPDLASGSAGPVTVDPRITLVQSRHLLFGGPNQFPSSITGGAASPFYMGLINFRLGSGQCEPNPPAGLATTFQGGNGQAGNMFDLKATNAAGLTVSGWQINLNDEVTASTPVTVRIYRRVGSFVGHENSPDGWALLGTADVLSWGANQATPVPIGGLSLPFDQTVGVFITTDFITSQPPPASPPFLNYTNQPPAATQFTSADLVISGGVGKANPLFTGATFFARMWNGGVLYSVGGGCYPDCNKSGSLTIADFTCFQARFVAGDPYADCNQSGTLTVADFTCFQAAFVAGCL